VSVELWNDFINEACNGNWDTAPDYSPPKFNRPCDPVRSEFSVQMFLLLNLFINLNKVFDVKFSFHYEYDGTLVGEPDFVATNLAGDLRLVIEAKTISSLAADDLVQAFHNDVHARATGGSTGVPVYNQICQIYGYLSNNELRYRAITNYSNTWFLFRPDKSKLCISPPVSCDATQPTVFQCFTTIAILARSNPVCSAKSPSPSSSPPPNDDKNDPPFIPKQKRGADEPVDRKTSRRRTWTTGGGRAGMSSDRRVLVSIHSYGYIHGDVRKENILVKRTGDHFNAFFIDFAFARRGSQAEFYGEKRALAQLL
jgi:hypothetical protein